MPLPSRGVVAFILGKHGPKDAGMLVGDGDQGLVVALATIQLDDPALQSTGACGLRIDGRLQCTASTLNQQGAQIDVAAQADPSQSGPAAGAVLPRREAEPGAKLTTILEDLGIRNRYRQRTRCEGADTHQFTRALRHWAVSDMSRDLRVTARQTGVQRGEL